MQRSDKRWEATFKSVNPSAGEQKSLLDTINQLRRVALPVLGDAEVPMLPFADIIRYEHCIPRTSLRLVYDFDDAKTVLYLVSLHRR